MRCKHSMVFNNMHERANPFFFNRNKFEIEYTLFILGVVLLLYALVALSIVIAVVSIYFVIGKLLTLSLCEVS